MLAKKDDDLADIRPLERYVEVLIEEYPNPIAHKDLASKANVTKSAITKIKNRLYGICEVKELVYRRKLVLKTNQDTVSKLFTLFFFNSKINKFLKSRYGRTLIKKFGVHKRLSVTFPEYPNYFTEADTNFMINVGLNVSDAFGEIGKIRSKVTDSEELQYITSMKMRKAVEKAFDRLPLQLKDEKDLKQILSIRDKMFFLVRAWLNQKATQLSIMNTLKDDVQRQLYYDIYVQTIDYYLRRLFDSFSDSIRQIAEKMKISYEENYWKTGTFFKPED